MKFSTFPSWDSWGLLICFLGLYSEWFMVKSACYEFIPPLFLDYKELLFQRLVFSGIDVDSLIHHITIEDECNIVQTARIVFCHGYSKPMFFAPSVMIIVRKTYYQACFFSQNIACRCENHRNNA